MSPFWPIFPDASVLTFLVLVQEVDEMLQTRMSVEDEEAVQAELQAMEAEQASPMSVYRVSANIHLACVIVRLHCKLLHFQMCQPCCLPR